jgi:signal peptidase I
MSNRNAGLGGMIPEVLKTLLLALIIFLTARLLLLPYQVDGQSMDPSLQHQERVLVNRAVYMHLDVERWIGWIPGISVPAGDFYPFHSPDRGDIVVFNPPISSAEPFIKRVIAVAGDTITIADGVVTVNGSALDETYLEGVVTTCDASPFCDELVLPEGTVFVMGDNREHSLDSRSFGPVPLDYIIGMAWFANWPSDRFGPLPNVQLDVP